MKKLIELFRDLKSKDKNRLVKITIGLVLIVVVFSAYQFTKDKDRQIPTRTDAKKNTLQFDKRTFEKTIYNKTRADVDDLRNELLAFKKEVRDTLAEQFQAAQKIQRYGEKKRTSDALLNPPGPGKTNGKVPPKNLSFTPPLPVVEKMQRKKATTPERNYFQGHRSRGKPSDNKKNQPPIKQIAVYANPQVTAGGSQEANDIEVHLPPSFMEANLLNGVTAPATDVGRNNPIPMLIRVNNLAVLPNNVKSNTKGCFVVAEGYGSLADERVHARLLSLSCINQKGGTVIDQAIKGFVVDTDGKEGMKGHVYAKFGQQIARVAIAGFLEGLGDAMSLGQQEFTYGVNTGVRTGQFKDTDPETLAKAGIGQGIVNVAEDLQKFYLDLAEQSLPVIEVHPTKNITIVISEGVDIAIKKQETSKVELEG